MTVSSPDAPRESEPAELVRRIAAQDREAFSALFLAIGPRLKGHFMRRGASDAAAEELVQETMLTVWRKAALFDSRKASAATWIFVIARNLRIDSLRRERADVLYGEPPPDIADASAPPDAEALAREREGRVRAALQALTQEQREVVRRSFFEDEPHARIAEDLRLPLGTVKSRLRLAMGKLRALLEDLR